MQEALRTDGESIIVYDKFVGRILSSMKLVSGEWIFLSGKLSYDDQMLCNSEHNDKLFCAKHLGFHFYAKQSKCVM